MLSSSTRLTRLTRSLADFAKLVELFDANGVSFVSVTQQFNTTTSMGRLTLNVLLSFAQFEREVTGERIRNSCVTASTSARSISRARSARQSIRHSWNGTSSRLSSASSQSSATATVRPAQVQTIC